MRERMIVAGFVFALTLQVVAWGAVLIVALHFVQKWW